MEKQTHVIQFSDLDEMLAELNPGDVVRVQALCDVESSVHEGMVQVRAYGVAVRHITATGHILSCWIRRYRAQIMRNHDEGKEETGWSMAKELEQQVRAYLDESQLDIRPGVIYVDRNQLIVGDWKNRPNKRHIPVYRPESTPVPYKRLASWGRIANSRLPSSPPPHGHFSQASGRR